MYKTILFCIAFISNYNLVYSANNNEYENNFQGTNNRKNNSIVALDFVDAIKKQQSEIIRIEEEIASLENESHYSSEYEKEIDQLKVKLERLKAILVNSESDLVNEYEETKKKAVLYKKLIPSLVNGKDNQQSEITRIEEEIASLENESHYSSEHEKKIAKLKVKSERIKAIQANSEFLLVFFTNQCKKN